MAISTCVALPRIVPAYCNFPSRIKAHRFYSCGVDVASTRSNRFSTSITSAQRKTSPAVFKIVRIISEKDDKEVEALLDRLQNAYQILKLYVQDEFQRLKGCLQDEFQRLKGCLQDGFQRLKGCLQDCIFVLMAINPFVQHFADGIVSNNFLVCKYSISAFYGALIALKGCAKLSWKSQPIWAFVDIIAGLFIYKANMWNISLHKDGRKPVRDRKKKPPAVLACGKLLEVLWLLFMPTKRTPFKIIYVAFGIVLWFTMSDYYLDDDAPVER